MFYYEIILSIQKIANSEHPYDDPLGSAFVGILPYLFYL